MNALVIEDDAQMHKSLCRALTRWGFFAASAYDGHDGLKQWLELRPAVVLLDLSLPGMDGLDVLQQGRAQGLATPVLLLTARGTVGDRILGLNIGADDYLPKPFELDELEARLRALLRRLQSAPPPTSVDRPRTLGSLVWEPNGAAFYCGDEPLALTPREAALLRALVERPNYAHTKEYLTETVFGDEAQPDAVEVLAHRLRKKLARCGASIVTLRGVGYLIKAGP